MPDGPNVLLVMCDQMRGQAMSCAGNPNVSTPAIDRLAENGTRFENAYSTYPVCVPSRYTLVTGQCAHRAHVPSIGWQLPPCERTVADEFADANYETAWIGKWHLGDEIHNPQHRHREAEDRGHGVVAPVPRDLQGGFEYWRGFELRNNHQDTYYFVDDDPQPRPVEGYQTDGLTDLTIEYLTEDRDEERPFFCVLSVEPPHPPYEAPDKYERRWANRDLELRPNVALDTEEPAASAGAGFKSVQTADEGTIDDLRSYYAMIENLDDNLTRVLETLEAEGLREDTVVVFLSDHGDMMGSHGLMQKHWPFEESIGVPFVISRPDEVDAGRVVSAPTCSEDWFPTLLGLAGIEPERECDGVNLAPFAHGEGDGIDREGVLLELYAEHRDATWSKRGDGFDFKYAPYRGFVTEKYKYTVLASDGGPAEPWQLFNLDDDPYEQRNVVTDSEYEGVARRLHGLLRDRLIDTDDDFHLAGAFGHDPL